MLNIWDEEDYRRACAALYRRCQRRGWVYNQPSHCDTEITEKGVLILRNVRGELGRYDTRKQRLIALRSV